MNEVKVSPKYQVVIPREVREQMHIRPGQKMMVVAAEDSIVLVPSKPLREYVGLLKGMDWHDIREKQDRPL